MESDYTPSKEHDMSNQDAAAVEAMANEMLQSPEGVCDFKEHAMAIARTAIAAIRERKVPTIHMHPASADGADSADVLTMLAERTFECDALRARCESAEAQIALTRDEHAQRSKTEALRVLWDGNRQKDEDKARTAMEALGVSTHWDCTSGKTIGAMVLEMVEVAKKTMAERDAARREIVKIAAERGELSVKCDAAVAAKEKAERLWFEERDLISKLDALQARVAELELLR